MYKDDHELKKTCFPQLESILTQLQMPLMTYTNGTAYAEQKIRNIMSVIRSSSGPVN